MMKRVVFLAASILLAESFAFGQAQTSDKHPFTGDDWAAIRSASAVAVAPDGATILYHVVFGAASGPENEEWRLISAAGANSRKLELPDHFVPFGFTRDGRALYGSLEVNKAAQLAVFHLASLRANSTPSLLLMLPAGIHSAVLSPDGSRFAILADPRIPEPMPEVHRVIEPDQNSLYVVNADGTEGAWWCAASQKTSNASTPELHDVAAIAWSSDGSSIAVLSQTPKIGFHYVRSFIDVCRADMTLHVAEIANVASNIAWAEGGKELAFLGTTSSVLTVDHVWTVPISGGTPVDRTPSLDGSALDLSGDPRGNVWVQVDHGVQNEIDSFQNGKLKMAFRWPNGVIESTPVFSEIAAAPGQLAFTVGDPQHADNIAVPQGTALKKITSESDDLLSQVDLGPVQVVHWTSKEGIALEGIVTFPARYVDGKRYPFVVLPHGGPEMNDLLNLGDSIEYYAYNLAKALAGLGYVVLQPEYRGSTGYGTAFLDAIYQHFGDRAYRDVDSATDYAIGQGWADPNRLAIVGWSAGGFMTSWTVTQTHRYRAAIEGAGITDWMGYLWTSDVQQIDYDARWPEKDPAAFLQFSAVWHADKVTTPLLVLHGDADVRVPTYQGREFFEALAAHGKTTRMVTYPGSGHFPRLWEQRRDIFREIAEWLAKYNP
jgi:dipeptidyl aminopeptidase/acylaminoacyl peptidase